MPLLRLVVCCCVAIAGVSAQIPSPKDVLGFKPGTDGMLADYDQILAYHQKLAAAADRVTYEVVGKTTEGRDMVSVVISSPKNLARLDEIRAQQATLADPRRTTPKAIRTAVKTGKVVVLVNESIHSTEVGPAQAGMVTAHFLATTKDRKWIKVLDNVVVVLTPCHNPDGYATVVGWWNKWKDDKKTRGVGLPVLYHKYVGHDNNRDWFMLTQAETRVTVTEMHLKWKPQIVVDQHQMGSSGARMFVPPYTEPYEPFVHPLLRKQLEDLGRTVLNAMKKDGLKGVWCNRRFDAWTPARAFMHYHGGVRILTEVASARLADPIARQRPPRGDAGTKSTDNPAPWKGGRWGLDDIVRYTSRGALLAIKHGADNREKWLKNFAKIHQDFCDGKKGPAAYVIPRITNTAANQLCDLLTLGAVEVSRTTKEITVGGRKCPPGSLLIKNGQPYFGFASALLENSPYPVTRGANGRMNRPYDMTCHALPLLMDFDVVRATANEIPAEAKPVVAAKTLRAQPTTTRAKGRFGLDPNDEGSYIDVLTNLARGVGVKRVVEREGASYPLGAFIVESDEFQLRHATPVVLGSWLSPSGRGSRSGCKVETLKPRRIGVYWSWTASMDEGWTRFLFDGFGIPFTRIRPADVRAGNLSDKIDVLLFASVDRRSLVGGPRDRKLPEEYRGGLGDAGQQALKTFVESGGTMVTMNASSGLPMQLFDLPVSRGSSFGRGGRGRGRGGENRVRTSIPGSIMRARVDVKHSLGWGGNEMTPVFLREARPFEIRTSEGDATVQFPVRYATKDVVLGGYATGAEVLHGKAAVAIAKVKKGTVVMFAFSPQFRCQTWSTYRLLFNALLQ
ncbi:MAG: hypothetical protein CMJ83_11375 [Planctomycetes bacterium]|nr:hypothetical protein [Planctomycetota bacterium]